MKLYFITILFSFVIVFVNSEKIKFMKQVIINNDYIRQTLRAEKLHTAVKNILSGSEPMADVSLMLAVPDFAVTSANVRKLTISTSREEDLGKILKQLMSDCIQPHPHSQREVKGIVTPVVGDRDAERANIVALANERRVLIMEAITKIASEGGLNVESLWTCRLVGLFRSMIYFESQSYMVEAKVELGVCKLTTKLDIGFKYVQYPDGIYELVRDGSTIKLEKFN
ncbi:uncharacterized protein LOC126847441 isoform X1 [Adelges cooleyi]|uniref:uncharacterized protein LOC126847441 isoform X1 n=2 Tax=Adelges cooleyi TaxID=133065 RepID=UPI00217FDED1|nr:uncharacterized protein LOC126847441 isoform X1 [Adelges cooleyi]XP_050443627.1 uncharacterized protein LOC126847441 isoform X1 [Adelges cooleyi]XP_050443637.1 uncharacterized protein LOC126847441 isoform X1 [Adelges cooleyi]XP_050443645.1 uncharacterized protein LOC126847441 isoform X1 [Adelges cooleyi]